MAAYKTTHKNKCNSADPYKLVTDPTLYMGSGGTVFALQKVAQLLKHENANSGMENIELDTEHIEEEETKEGTPKSGAFNYDAILEKYQNALAFNMNLVKKDKNGHYEHGCSSYFMSAHVGLHTLVAMDYFDDDNLLEDEAACKALRKLILHEILPAGRHCLDDVNEPEDEILYGTAGYLFSILSIFEKLKKIPSGKFDSETQKV